MEVDAGSTQTVAEVTHCPVCFAKLWELIKKDGARFMWCPNCKKRRP